LGLQEVAKLCYRRGGGVGVLRGVVGRVKVIPRGPGLRGRGGGRPQGGGGGAPPFFARGPGARAGGVALGLGRARGGRRRARRAGVAPTGGGRIRVLFSPPPSTADDELMRLARELGNGAVVVSSDRKVQDAARRAGSAVLAAEQFLEALEAPVTSPGSDTPDI